MAFFFSVNDIIFNYYFMFGGVFLSYLVYRIFHLLLCGNNYMQSRYKIGCHIWRSIECNKSVPYNIYCTVCGKLMLASVGLFCECCAISACKKCNWIIDKKFKCKQLTYPSDKSFLHHWVKIGSTRENNEQSEEVINRFYCCWCQRVKLFNYNPTNDAEECDLQKYRNIIIPPVCVELEKGTVTNIKHLSNNDWEPLIIFANRKSGSSKGDEVLSLFRGLLNPIQVVDLSVTSPESVVRWLPERCRVLAAGGDGTVAWVLNAVNAAPKIKAAVAILPLGTGNDLSRALGWGSTCSSPLDATAIIDAIMRSQEQLLDRWKITIKPRRRRLGRAGTERVLYAYNYASVGVDAQVALDFHRARTQFLYRYASRTLNYIAYVCLGAGRALDDGGCGALEQRLRVRVGGSRDPLPLPPLQALVVLNIPSWGAGLDLWSLGSEEVSEQSINDRKIEVVGISSSFHIARLQCGLAEPYRFAQTSRVQIELSGSCAMQVDGEPWMQSAASITIEPAGQSTVLRAARPEEL